MTDQVKYTQKLSGDKVLVIGGSSGIGYGVAEALLENGCIVIISSSNPKRVKKTIEKLQSLYPSAKGRISGHACDLGNSAALESNIKALLDQAGTLDHIIFTAGDQLAIQALENVNIESIQKAGNVRFFAPLLVAKHARQYLSGGPKSSLTLTTGAVSQRPMPDWSVINSYCTGLEGMTRGLALDLKPTRVNLVSPGMVKTELWDSFTEEQRESMYAETAKILPTGKVGTVEDVAEAYIYLLRDRNTTGSMISTNSGHLLLGP